MVRDDLLELLFGILSQPRFLLAEIDASRLIPAFVGSVLRRAFLAPLGLRAILFFRHEWATSPLPLQRMAANLAQEHDER